MTLATQAHRGPNHVLVSRRSSRAALLARARKLLASRRWDAVYVHGLGAALAPAIALAATLVEESNGRLEASCSTSTEAIVDRCDDEAFGDSAAAASAEGAQATIRHNSAIHIALRVVDGAQNQLAMARTSGAQPQRKRAKRTS